MNPDGINLQVPSPDFSYGTFKHVQIGESNQSQNLVNNNQLLSFHQDGISQSNLTQSEIQSELPSQRKFY